MHVLYSNFANFGVGQPVAFFCWTEETEKMISTELKYFCDNNDNSITEVVFTDKDCAEITAIAQLFPHSTQLLCHFHVLRALDRYLKRLEDGNLGNYFDTFWFSDKCVKKWPMKERRGLCKLGNHTFQTGTSLEKSSDTSYMAQIINILSDEDKLIKSITFLVSFGLVKIIVWLYVDEQLKRRKSRRDEENEKEETKMNDPPTPQVPNPPCVVVISENQSSTSRGTTTTTTRKK
ncbi:hypothetical protein DAPPUDRAFT_115821 [Daphnia pulex]|uniref:ZSWIM1/3 RNaseH-like domain-containing protein n=1 Tax=Daphnia pulex TaxID=6669 RepID=E9HMM9_DAPPU|nr:hypothetical protein DAPPUDRAFT_115821 [Daphnia pulex]|eukprot:EFX66997.1 hypothetical protein DAPPUDRAFT_115821 [Daphnia pulex]